MTSSKRTSISCCCNMFIIKSLKDTNCCFRVGMTSSRRTSISCCCSMGLNRRAPDSCYNLLNLFIRSHTT
ncbi:hypothetical protein KC19_1G143800 [Ceratodon purpureus]|uniref:Uncharacterized protein n=1 Tax=Ceratodon purpureus TaxID=3225 RepID=A0A8T0J534_CERPU|nr:hypothetical protein KC19_1G143800 [Ceratodon purpureus]